MNGYLTKQRWLESNDYGKELFVDELLARNSALLAALEAITGLDLRLHSATYSKANLVSRVEQMASLARAAITKPKEEQG